MTYQGSKALMNHSISIRGKPPRIDYYFFDFKGPSKFINQKWIKKFTVDSKSKMIVIFDMGKFIKDRIKQIKIYWETELKNPESTDFLDIKTGWRKAKEYTKEKYAKEEIIKSIQKLNKFHNNLCQNKIQYVHKIKGNNIEDLFYGLYCICVYIYNEG